MFNIKSAHKLLENLKHEDYEITSKIIEQCYQFSQMTVLNEQSNMNRYYWLNFVEFLDMLCRIAIVAITREDTLDYKTQQLLEILYAHLYKSGQLDKKEYPLYPVDENLR